VIPPASIGAMSSNRVILSELLSSRARLRFPGQPHPATTTPARRDNLSERLTGTLHTVSLLGVTPLITGVDDPEADETGGKRMIHYLDRRTEKSAPVSGLKHRLARAKKYVCEENRKQIANASNSDWRP